MARRRPPKQENQGGDSWLTTYGDLVTLLLTFFVLLFSFSTIDAQKWRSFISSFAGGSGILDGGMSIGDSDVTGDELSGDLDIEDFYNLIPENLDDYKELEEDQDLVTQDTDAFVRLYRSIEEFLDEQGIPGEVKISEAHTEILLRFKDSVLFDTGEADIIDDAKEVLAGISKVLLEFDDQISRIRIDGHADIRPINTRLYPTNWELSAKRAVNVVRYFSEEQGLEASKLSAAAYGEFHPIDQDKSPESLARNRRVEIFIVRVVEPAQIIEEEE